MNETMPTAREGYRLVTKDAFYESIGQMNVHPYPQARWSDVFGYVAHWKTPAGDVVGLSDSYEGGRYWVKA